MGSDLAKGRDGSPSRPGGGSAGTTAWTGAHLVKMLAVSLFGLGSLIVGFTGRVDPDLFRKTESDISTGRRPLRFGAESAWSTTREFVTQFPNRVFGSLESRQATGFLTDRLAAAGYQVEYTHYDGRIGGGARAGRNVLAFKQGETDEIIAITAHFDSARPTVQGASKNGAAVGTLLELAGIFSKEKTRRSLLFAFTDGGEWGSTGARDLSLNYAGKDRIVAVLSLDHVASGDLAGLRLGTTGQLRGSTPSWLRAAALKVVNFDGTPVAVARDSNLSSVLSAAFLISQSDQGPFLRAGIPAINLGSYSRDEKREAEILRSSEDTIDKLKVESIGRYGLAAEGIVRLIDGVERIPREASSGRLVY